MAGINKVKLLLRIEGIFYLLLGLWPLLHQPSFLQFTGFKTDTWLAVTAGSLLALYGLSFLIESRSRHVSKSVVTLAVAAPLILLWIDVYYVFSGVISQVYMIDALIENLLLLCWILVLITDRISLRNRYS